MNRFWKPDMNYYWFGLVLLHIGGSVVAAGLAGILGMGQLFSSVLLNTFMLCYVCFIMRGMFTPMSYYFDHTYSSRKLIIATPLFVITGLMVSAFLSTVSAIWFHNYVEESLASLQQENALIVILAYAILPALIEELMFRGVMMKLLGRRMRSVIISAALFALLHTNINQIIYAFFMGILLGIMMYLTGNLLYSIIVHLCFNLYSIILILEPDYLKFLDPYYRLTGTLAGKGAAALAALAVIIILVLWLKQDQKNTDSDASLCGEQLTDDAGTDWKPDYRFIIGCALCIVIALTMM